MFPHLNLKTNEIVFFLNRTNTGEIFKITKSLKASNSSGIDNISTKLLKMIINEITPFLSHIFNRSLLSGIAPSKLKLLKLIQFLNRVIIKCSVTIGLSPYYLQFQKFLKKLCILAFFFEFVTKNKILSSHQYGFI